MRHRTRETVMRLHLSWVDCPLWQDERGFSMLTPALRASIVLVPLALTLALFGTADSAAGGSLPGIP